MRQNSSVSTMPPLSSRSSLPNQTRPQLQASLIFGVILISLSTTLCVVLSLQVLNSPQAYVPDDKAMHIAMMEGSLRGASQSSISRTPLLAPVNKEALRIKYPPSIWTTRRLLDQASITEIKSKLTNKQKEQAEHLCGKFLYSSLHRAVNIQHGNLAFVATGDIDDMWLRDSSVQIGIYFNRPQDKYLRLVVEGTIRRNAFNILQDPYANAFSREWRDPKSLLLKEQVIGRGGWVSTRNYELDSGAYFLQQLYDYYVSENTYQPEALLKENIVVDAVILMIDTWILEQHHDEKSPYRYFELPNQGKGPPSTFTGMTWSAFRPSDDPCQFGYLIPANIHAAAALERVLVLNGHIWHSREIKEKGSRLLRDISDGINKYGIVEKDGVRLYAYEVDGYGAYLADFDDANVPSLLSIPLLAWSGYDEEVYAATRQRLLSPINPYWFEGTRFKGIGSPHTPVRMIWSMAMAIQALTEKENVADTFAFQLAQSLNASCNDAMHESIHVDQGCPQFTRSWFEWANALFVVLVETGLGITCDSSGRTSVMNEAVNTLRDGVPEHPEFYQNVFNNDFRNPLYYQGIEARIKHT